MAQIWLLWWPKTAPSATKTGGASDSVVATTSDGESFLTKLTRKLRNRGRRILRSRRRPTTSFQCRYDPLSYALNFDTTSYDEDYYQFCAFSSRFVANSSQRLAVAVPTSLVH